MADTPFGLSFGTPNRYIGSSGIGQAVKTGLTAYGMQKSGLTDWLNNLSKKPEGQTVVPGSVPLPKSFDQYLSQNPTPVVPPTPQQLGVNIPSAVPAVPEETPIQQVPAQQAPMPTNQELGLDWLGGKLSNFVNPQAQRDIPVAQGGGYTEQLGSGMDYQKVPGYGKLAKAMQAMGGLG